MKAKKKLKFNFDFIFYLENSNFYDEEYVLHKYFCLNTKIVDFIKLFSLFSLVSSSNSNKNF